MAGEAAGVVVGAVVFPFAYDVVINGSSHVYNSLVTDTADDIRDGLIQVINAGVEPVTAVPTQSGGAGVSRLGISPDQIDLTQTYAVSANLSLTTLTVLLGTLNKSFREQDGGNL